MGVRKLKPQERDVDDRASRLHELGMLSEWLQTSTLPLEWRLAVAEYVTHRVENLGIRKESQGWQSIT